MKIEVPRKTAYYKKKQAEAILTAMKETFFLLKDSFWDFIVIRDGNIRLIKAVSSKENLNEIVLDDEGLRFDREIWRFSPSKKMPEIQIFAHK